MGVFKSSNFEWLKLTRKACGSDSTLKMLVATQVKSNSQL